MFAVCGFVVFAYSSVQPRKQRKRRFLSPLHIRGHFVRAHLSKELRQKLGKRTLRIKKGDKVRIMRGKFKKKEGNVVSVDLRKGKIYVEGITIRKARGQEALRPIDPSKVMIIQLAERK